MAGIYDAVYTIDGGILLSDVIVKGAQLNITKMVIGSGYMPDGKSMGQMREVVEPVVEMPIAEKVRLDDQATMRIRSNFSNEEVQDGFFYRELGVFVQGIYPDGKTSEETLYLYGNAGDSAEYIPAHGGTTVVQKRIDLLTYVGSKTNVKVDVIDGLNVTREEFAEEIGKINETISGLRMEIEGIDITEQLRPYAKTTEVDQKLTEYHKKTEVYTKNETDTKLAEHYKKTETYTKQETDNAINTAIQQNITAALNASY